jgi:hypothetical protein
LVGLLVESLAEKLAKKKADEWVGLTELLMVGNLAEKSAEH